MLNVAVISSLFSWPEGITAWAIIATLFVIGWQSWETRRSAEIAARSLVAQFRPRVVVRNISLDPLTVAEFDKRGNGLWEVVLLIVNEGGNVARVTSCAISTLIRTSYPTLNSESIGKENQVGFSLRPGERKQLRVKITYDQFRITMHVIEHVATKNETQYTAPVCSGEVTYQDEHGWERRTGFERMWDANSRTFKPSDNPSVEYID